MVDAQVALKENWGEGEKAESRKVERPKRGGSGRSTANQRWTLIGGEEEQREVKSPAEKPLLLLSGPSSPSCPVARACCLPPVTLPTINPCIYPLSSRHHLENLANKHLINFIFAVPGFLWLSIDLLGPPLRQLGSCRNSDCHMHLKCYIFPPPSCFMLAKSRR